MKQYVLWARKTKKFGKKYMVTLTNRYTNASIILGEYRNKSNATLMVEQVENCLKDNVRIRNVIK